MIILTNALSRHDDEGSLKLANGLITAVRRRRPDARIITYENESPLGSLHLRLNKFLLSARLTRELRREKGSILFAPKYTRMLPMAGKVLTLSLCAGRRLTVLVAMCPKPRKSALMLLRLSGAKFIAMSDQSCKKLTSLLPNPVFHLKAAVDTAKFAPLTGNAAEAKRLLREKYSLPTDRKIVLHVGHMKHGRNVEKLLSLDKKYHAVLVTSTTTAAFRDADLEEKLRSCPNLTIIDTYIPKIEEIYQLSDVYFTLLPKMFSTTTVRSMNTGVMA